MNVFVKFGGVIMKVINANGTGKKYPEPSCKCNTWLEHWENNKIWQDGGKCIAGWCRACGEKYKHEKLNGGHVNKYLSEDKKYYIVPICDSCNAIDGLVFDVNESDLVEASSVKCNYK